ncbi:MAG TPA: hypothetical protein VMT88_04760 [Actinomycetes bacterium]|nr:hypothetical protein [Actinomycetes bacterium]
MSKGPSRLWYALALAIAFIPVGWAGFDLGGQVRHTLSAVAEIPSDVGVVIHLDAGEGRTIFSRGLSRAGWTDQVRGCRVSAASGEPSPVVENVDIHVEVTLFEDTWVAKERFVAGRVGTYTVTCPSGSWALGPDVGSNGLGIATTFAGWTARAAAWVIPALLIGSVIAVVVATRRRKAAT